MRKPSEQTQSIPSPCPKCGSMLLARGAPISVLTPRFLRGLYGAAGVTCTKCGNYERSLWKWNKAAAAEPMRRLHTDEKTHYNGVILYGFGSDGVVHQEAHIPNMALGSTAIWSYMERKYLPVYRPLSAMDKPWYREDMSDEEFLSSYGRWPSRITNQIPRFMQEVFDLVDRPDIPEGERLVLATTLDWHLLHREDIPTAIQAFQAFPADSNLPAQADVLESFLQYTCFAAVGWRQSPFRGIDWAHVPEHTPGLFDANAPSYNFISGKSHVWIERSGKKDLH